MASIKNFIAIDVDDKIIWNPELGQLEAGEAETKQILLLTSRPYFSVKDVKLSPLKNLLALSGDNGVMIVEMPRKFGGRYKSDKDNQIYCKTYLLDERKFRCEKRLRTVHVAWHPHGIESKQELCILTNDNRIQFYDAGKNLELQVINLRVQCANEESDDDDDFVRVGMSMLNLGESAICFDFGPPFVQQKSEVLWPIYILMGTGDILLIYTSPNNPLYSEHVIGPLTILPQAEDNYGSDACSLLVLDSSPPLLAIASPTGTIYHCFAFPDKQALLTKQTLYVYEAIELSKDLIENPDDPYSPHPLKLFRDPTSEIRYFVVHENGVHTVVVPMLESIQSEGDITRDKESFSEFLVCTRTTTPSQADDDCDDLSTPRGLGVDIRQSNIALLVLMPKNELIVHRISPATTLINRKRFPRHAYDTSRDSIDQEILNVSQVDASQSNFDEQIQQILKRRTSVPMLKLSEDLEQSGQMNELVDKAINTFKTEYIKKFNLAAEAIKKKSTVLEQDMLNQKTECNKIFKEKEEVYIAVIALSSKADIACQKQKELLNRIDRILSAVAYGHPELSESEAKNIRDLKALREKLGFYRDQLDSTINKHKYHMNQREPHSKDDPEVTLSPNQLNAIKDTLSRQGAEIAELKRLVKSSQNK